MNSLRRTISQVSDLYSNATAADQSKIRDRLERLSNNLNCVYADQKPHEKAKALIEDRLRGFIVEESRAYKELERRGLGKLPQRALLSIAQVIAKGLNINIDRAAKRCKPVLMKWYDENFDVVFPALDKLKLEFNGEEESNKQDIENENDDPGKIITDS